MRITQIAVTVLLVVVGLISGCLIMVKAFWPLLAWLWSVTPDPIMITLRFTGLGILMFLLGSLFVLLAPFAWPFGPLIAKVWNQKMWQGGWS